MFGKIIRVIYHKAMFLAAKKHAVWVLAAISFAGSSFFPIPQDVFLIAMILAQPTRAFFLAFVCTISSVLGAYLGYGIGMFFFDTVAQPLMAMYGYMEQFYLFKDYYHEFGYWIVFGGGFTPFPYKIVTIASGAVGLDLWILTIGSLMSRGIRFFLIAYLLWRFGERAHSFLKNNFGKVATIFFLVGLLIFSMMKLL